MDTAARKRDITGDWPKLEYDTNAKHDPKRESPEEKRVSRPAALLVCVHSALIKGGVEIRLTNDNQATSMEGFGSKRPHADQSIRFLHGAQVGTSAATAAFLAMDNPRAVAHFRETCPTRPFSTNSPPLFASALL